MTAPSPTSNTRPSNPSDDSPLAHPLQFLRIADVCRLLRISKPTLWRLRQSCGFPSPTHMHIPAHRGHAFHDNVNADSSATYSRFQVDRSHG